MKQQRFLNRNSISYCLIKSLKKTSKTADAMDTAIGDANQQQRTDGGSGIGGWERVPCITS
jgi:hypothetical protein